MSKFKYEGFTAQGQPHQGVLDANSIGDAAEILRMNKIFAQKIEPDDGVPIKGVFSQLKTTPNVETVQTSRQGGVGVIMRTPEDQQPQQLPWDAPKKAPTAPAPSLGFSGTQGPPPAAFSGANYQFSGFSAEMLEQIKPDWKEELKRDLETINEVVTFCEKNPKMFGKLPKPGVKKGKDLAVEELVAKAIAAAVKKAL